MKTADESILIYALPAGEDRDYMEQIISFRSKTQQEVDSVIKAATADGWHSFRVVDVSNITRPDFTKGVHKHEK